MGIFKDVMFGLIEPFTVMCGISLGIFWLSKPRSNVALAAVAVLLINLVVQFTKFETEARHGKYDYQKSIGFTPTFESVVSRPETMQAEFIGAVRGRVAAEILIAAGVIFAGLARKLPAQ